MNFWLNQMISSVNVVFCCGRDEFSRAKDPFPDKLLLSQAIDSIKPYTDDFFTDWDVLI